MKLSLKTKKEIEKKIDKFIEMAEDLIEFSWKEKKDREQEKEMTIYKERVGRTQIRNILDMATQVESISALILFIKYQIGRKQIPREWGEKLIEKISELEFLAEEIDKENKNEVMHEISKLFLGYMYRDFVYKHEMKELRNE